MFNDKVFREWVNSVPIDLPDNMEEIEEMDEEEDITPPKSERALGEKSAAILRFSFDVYLIQPQDDSTKAYMVNANPSLEDMGIMKIKEALKMIKKKQ